MTTRRTQKEHALSSVSHTFATHFDVISNYQFLPVSARDSHKESPSSVTPVSAAVPPITEMNNLWPRRLGYILAFDSIHPVDLDILIFGHQLQQVFAIGSFGQANGQNFLEL